MFGGRMRPALSQGELMADPSESELSLRLRQLPRQLLLALINGTAILVIAAAILALIATSKVTHLAHTVAATMTDAVLSRVGENPRQAVENIRRVSEDVHTLTVALRRAKAEGVSGLGPEVADLNERLVSLQANLDRLRSARSDLMDEFVAKVGTVVGEALQNFTACPRRAGADAAVSSLTANQTPSLTGHR
jgi:hypothetical protein